MLSTIAVLVLGMLPTGPAPRIDVPMPTIVQMGTTADVTITGAHLAAVTGAVFSPDGGISAVVGESKGGRVSLKVTVAADAEGRERAVRLVGPDGVSNPRVLHLSSCMVMVEGPMSGAGPQRLALPSVLSGSMGRGTEIDRYRFTARPGRRELFHVEAGSIGSMLEPAFTVEDLSGRTVAWERQEGAGDVSIDFDPPDAGDYDLVLRDLRYRGGKGFHYHLHRGRGTGDATPGLADNGSFEEEPNNGPTTASELSVPGVIAGRIESLDDVDVFRFKVEKKQTLVLDAVAASPLFDALLFVHDATGKQLAVNDDGNGRDARIRRAFGPGIYTATVRDLTGAAGSAYTLSIAPPKPPSPSFRVRFLPDVPRVGRGSHRKLWCEVTRSGGFKGAVTLAISGLPDGVTASPVTLGPANAWTSVFTLAASADAPLGAAPFTIEATGTIDGRTVTRPCFPEVGGKPSRQAYVTVRAQPPMIVAPLGPPSAAQGRKYTARLQALREQLSMPSPEVEREFADWKRAIRESAGTWSVLAPTMLKAESSNLNILRDGSIIASGDQVQSDTYTLTAVTRVARVAALRLEVIPDESLPKGGPGRNPPSGNFVLNELTVTAAPQDRPELAKPVKLVNPAARFSQRNYDIGQAIDGNPATGWAIHPQEGRANHAVFDLATPVAFEGPAVFTVKIAQLHGAGHLLGRFRLSVAPSRLSGPVNTLPEGILGLVRSERNGPAEARELDVYFRTHVSKHLTALRRRIEQLEAGFGGDLEVEALEKQLRTQTPALTEAQQVWERELASKVIGWTPAEFTLLTSARGKRFEKQKGHVARVRGTVGPKDTYTVELKTDVRPITGIRLEALADKTLPSGGPGLAPNGNFVLSTIAVSSWPIPDPSSVSRVGLNGPQASFEQSGWPVKYTLDANVNNGWAVMGNTGKDSAATWRFDNPIDHANGTALRVVLAHRSVHVQHHIGRFRLSVTSAPKPGLGDRSVPADVATILHIPSSERTRKQAIRVAAHYRSIAPALEPVRKQIELMRAQRAPFPPKVARSKTTRLAVRVTRRAGFTGPVTLSLEGFSSGRDRNKNPRPLSANVKSAKKTAAPGQDVVILDLKPANNSEIGTRSIVIRAEAKIGKEVVVEYSAPIALTVSK